MHGGTDLSSAEELIERISAAHARGDRLAVGEAIRTIQERCPWTRAEIVSRRVKKQPMEGCPST